MRIGLVYNQRPDLDRLDPSLERFIEGDEWKTIESLGRAIEANGHKVTYFPIDENIISKLSSAKAQLDLLFNFSEGLSKGADREAHLPMIAEILGIPYTGPGPLSAALILNKARAKEIWHSNQVRTAAWQLMTTVGQKLNPKLKYPLIVKPNGEGSGIGIKKNSIVANLNELNRDIEDILTNYHQPALVEEYLPGREFTIALIGNGENLLTLPIVEINFDAFPKNSPHIDTYEAKFVYGMTGQAEETEFCPAKVKPGLERHLVQAAKAAYLSIGCRDFGRVDLRLDENDNVYVMEINHPPGLMSDPKESSFFTISGYAMGWDFKTMIGKILVAAITRLNLS